MTREEAIAVLESDAEYLYSQDSPYNRKAYQMAVEALKSEPKHGRWIKHNHYIECPLCHRKWNSNYNDIYAFNYCPNCGASMMDEVEDPYSADQTWAEYTLKQTSEVKE